VLELLILAIAPAVFLLIYFYLRDKYEPEPLGWVIRVFIIGAIMTVPAIILEAPFPSGLFLVVIIAPIVEESLKFSAVYFTVYRDREFDEPVDGIVYAVAAALGFAAVENVLYVMEGGIATGILRAFVSVPSHALFSAIWGYSLGLAKFRPAQARPFLIGAGLAGAIVFHGLFNLLASDSEIIGFIVIVILLVPFGWWLTNRNINRALEHPQSAGSRAKRETIEEKPAPEEAGEDNTNDSERKKIPPQNHYCSECGSPLSLSAKFCRVCGKRVDET
jgi:RsiW-degrading membrane proteinase PrsW (M82 family)